MYVVYTNIALADKLFQSRRYMTMIISIDQCWYMKSAQLHTQHYDHYLDDDVVVTEGGGGDSLLVGPLAMDYTSGYNICAICQLVYECMSIGVNCVCRECDENSFVHDHNKYIHAYIHTRTHKRS